MYKFICANIAKSRNFTNSYKKIAHNKKYHLDGTSSRAVRETEWFEEKFDDSQEPVDDENRLHSTPRRPSTSLKPNGSFHLASKLRNLRNTISVPSIKVNPYTKFYTGNFLTVEPPTPSISKKYFHIYSITPAAPTSKRSYSTITFRKFPFNEKARRNYENAMEDVDKIQKGKSEYQWEPVVANTNKPAFISSDNWAKKRKKKSSKTEIRYPTHTIKHNLTLSPRYRIREGPSTDRLQQELHPKFQKEREKAQHKFHKNLNPKKITYPTLMENLKKKGMASAMPMKSGITESKKEEDDDDVIKIVKKSTYMSPEYPMKENLQILPPQRLPNIEEDFESLIRSHPTIQNASKEVKMKLKTKFIQLLLKSSNQPTAQAQNNKKIETVIEEGKVREDGENLETKLADDSGKDEEYKEDIIERTITQENEDTDQITSHPSALTGAQAEHKDYMVVRYPKRVWLDTSKESFDVDTVCIKDSATGKGSGFLPRSENTEEPKLNYQNLEKEATKLANYVKLQDLRKKADETIEKLEKTTGSFNSAEARIEELKRERMRLIKELEKVSKLKFVEESKLNDMKEEVMDQQRTSEDTNISDRTLKTKQAEKLKKIMNRQYDERNNENNQMEKPISKFERGRSNIEDIKNNKKLEDAKFKVEELNRSARNKETALKKKKIVARLLVNTPKIDEINKQTDDLIYQSNIPGRKQLLSTTASEKLATKDNLNDDETGNEVILETDENVPVVGADKFPSSMRFKNEAHDSQRKMEDIQEIFDNTIKACYAEDIMNSFKLSKFNDDEKKRINYKHSAPAIFSSKVNIGQEKNPGGNIQIQKQDYFNTLYEATKASFDLSKFENKNDESNIPPKEFLVGAKPRAAEEKNIFPTEKPPNLEKNMAGKTENKEPKSRKKKTENKHDATVAAKSANNETLDDPTFTDELNETARRTKDLAEKKKSKQEERRLHEEIKQRQQSSSSLIGITPKPRLDKVVDLMKEKVQIGERVKEKIEHLNPNKLTRDIRNNSKIESSKGPSKSSVYEDLKQVAESLNAKKTRNLAEKDHKTIVEKDKHKKRAPNVLLKTNKDSSKEASPEVEAQTKKNEISLNDLSKTKKNEDTFTDEDHKIHLEKKNVKPVDINTDLKAKTVESLKVPYKEEQYNKKDSLQLSDNKVPLENPSCKNENESEDNAKIKEEVEKSEIDREKSEENPKLEEEKEQNDEHRGFALYPKSPKEGKKRDISLDNNFVEPNKQNTELIKEAFENAHNMENTSKERDATPNEIKQVDNLKNAVGSLQNIKKDLLIVANPANDYVQEEQGVKEFKEQILKGYFEEKILPGSEQNVYLPKERLVVSNITEIDDNRSLFNENEFVVNHPGMNVQDSAVLRTGDEIVILGNRISSTALSTVVRKIENLNVETELVDKAEELKLDLSQPEERVLEDVAKIDEIIEKVKSLEELLVIKKRSTLSDVKLENKPRAPPVPKQPPRTEKKEIKKDKPKGPRDIILPPKVRGSDPPGPETLKKEAVPKDKRALNKLTENSIKSTLDMNASTSGNKRLKIILRPKNKGTSKSPQKSDDLEKAISDFIQQEKLDKVETKKDINNDKKGEHVREEKTPKKSNEDKSLKESRSVNKATIKVFNRADKVTDVKSSEPSMRQKEPVVVSVVKETISKTGASGQVQRKTTNKSNSSTFENKKNAMGNENKKIVMAPSLKSLSSTSASRGPGNNLRNVKSASTDLNGKLVSNCSKTKSEVSTESVPQRPVSCPPRSIEIRKLARVDEDGKMYRQKTDIKAASCPAKASVREPKIRFSRMSAQNQSHQNSKSALKLEDPKTKFSSWSQQTLPPITKSCPSTIAKSMNKSLKFANNAVTDMERPPSGKESKRRFYSAPPRNTKSDPPKSGEKFCDSKKAKINFDGTSKQESLINKGNSATTKLDALDDKFFKKKQHSDNQIIKNLDEPKKIEKDKTAIFRIHYDGEVFIIKKADEDLGVDQKKIAVEGKNKGGSRDLDYMDVYRKDMESKMSDINNREKESDKKQLDNETSNSAKEKRDGEPKIVAKIEQILLKPSKEIEGMRKCSSEIKLNNGEDENLSFIFRENRFIDKGSVARIVKIYDRKTSTKIREDGKIARFDRVLARNTEQREKSDTIFCGFCTDRFEGMKRDFFKNGLKENDRPKSKQIQEINKKITEATSDSKVTKGMFRRNRNELRLKSPEEIKQFTDQFIKKTTGKPKNRYNAPPESTVNKDEKKDDTNVQKTGSGAVPENNIRLNKLNTESIDSEIREKYKNYMNSSTKLKNKSKEKIIENIIKESGSTTIKIEFAKVDNLIINTNSKLSPKGNTKESSENENRGNTNGISKDSGESASVIFINDAKKTSGKKITKNNDSISNKVLEKSKNVSEKLDKANLQQRKQNTKKSEDLIQFNMSTIKKQDTKDDLNIAEFTKLGDVYISNKIINNKQNNTKPVEEVLSGDKKQPLEQRKDGLEDVNKDPLFSQIESVYLKTTNPTAIDDSDIYKLKVPPTAQKICNTQGSNSDIYTLNVPKIGKTENVVCQTDNTCKESNSNNTKVEKKKNYQIDPKKEGTSDYLTKVSSVVDKIYSDTISSLINKADKKLGGKKDEKTVSSKKEKHSDAEKAQEKPPPYKCIQENAGFDSKNVFGERRDLYKSLKYKTGKRGLEKSRSENFKSASKSLTEKSQETSTNSKIDSIVEPDKKETPKIDKRELRNQILVKSKTDDSVTKSINSTNIKESIKKLDMKEIKDTVKEFIASKTKEKNEKDTSKKVFSRPETKSKGLSSNVRQDKIKNEQKVGADTVKEAKCELKEPNRKKTINKNIEKDAEELVKLDMVRQKALELPKEQKVWGVCDNKQGSTEILEESELKSEKNISKARSTPFIRPVAYLSRLEMTEQNRKREEIEKHIKKSRQEGHVKRQEEKSKKNLIENMNSAAEQIFKQKKQQEWDETLKGNRRQLMYEKDAKLSQPSSGSAPWGLKIRRENPNKNEDKKNIHNSTNVTIATTSRSGEKLMSKAEYLKLKKTVATKPEITSRKESFDGKISKLKGNKMVKLLPADDIKGKESKLDRDNLGQALMKNDKGNIKSKSVLSELLGNSEETELIEAIKNSIQSTNTTKSSENNQKEIIQVKEPTKIINNNKLKIDDFKRDMLESQFHRRTTDKKQELFTAKDIFGKKLENDEALENLMNVAKKDLDLDIKCLKMDDLNLEKDDNVINNIRKLESLTESGLKESPTELFKTAENELGIDIKSVRNIDSNLDKNGTTNPIAQISDTKTGATLQLSGTENTQPSVNEGYHASKKCGFYVKCAKLNDFDLSQNVSRKGGPEKMSDKLTPDGKTATTSSLGKTFLKYEMRKIETEKMAEEKMKNKMTRRLKTKNIKNMIYKKESNNVKNKSIENEKRRNITSDHLIDPDHLNRVKSTTISQVKPSNDLECIKTELIKSRNKSSPNIECKSFKKSTFSDLKLNLPKNGLHRSLSVDLLRNNLNEAIENLKDYMLETNHASSTEILLNQLE